MTANTLPLYLLPILLTVFGVLSCFYGYGLFKFTLVIIGFFGGIFLVMNYGPAFIADKTVLIIIAVSVGIILGILVLIFYYLGIFLSGAFAAFIIYSNLNLTIHGVDPLIIMIIIGIAGGIISILFQKIMIILSTAVLGAYGIVTGLAYFIYSLKNGFHAFPNFYGALKNYHDLYYILLFITAILAVCGFIFQFRMIPEERHRREE